MMVGVAWFLARSRYGLAIRASAERGDRAAMLGIPVGRLNTLVWAIAAAMSFVALFLRSGIIGVPVGYAAGLPALLQSLAALVIGRLERLPTIAAAAIALGLLESGVRFNSDTPAAAYPIMALVMFVVLLVQRTSQIAPRQRRRPARGAAPKRCGRCPTAERRHPKVRAGAVDARRRRNRRRARRSAGARRRLHASRRRPSSRSRSSGCRWWCSPVGPGRSRSGRWRSSASARRSARPAPRAGTST